MKTYTIFVKNYTFARLPAGPRAQMVGIHR